MDTRARALQSLELTRVQAPDTIMRMLQLTPIPALSDNYIWTLSREDGEAVVVDPGEVEPVLQHLNEAGLRLTAILVTHHHWDHTNGVRALRERFDVPVYASANERAPITGTTHPLHDDDSVQVLGETFRVIAIPGHTLGHVAYFGGGLLLSGDTLFSAGCGRVFEGEPHQMLASLDRLADLPGETRLLCGHEYTLSNLAFAQAVEPKNDAIRAYTDKIRALRAAGKPSLPSELETEHKINPFLRCRVAAVAQSAEQHAGRSLSSPAEVFATLREWKNNFRPPASR